MPILIACDCGKKLNVRDELAGKKVKCPACGSVLLAEALVEAIEADPAPPKPPPAPASRSRSTSAPVELQSDASASSFWECQRDFTKGLMVVTDDALWFAKLADKDLKRAKRLLSAGEDPEGVLEEEATRWQLRFCDLQGINFNKRLAQMNVDFPGADEKETSTIHFDDHAMRDEAFKELRRRLGKTWTYNRRDLNRFQAMLSPLLLIGGLVLVFGFFVFLAWAFEQPTDGRPRVVRTSLWGLLVAYTVGWLGPLWTGVLGGVCVIGAVAWMMMRIADPPIEITLQPRPKESAADEEENDEEPRSKRRRRSRDDEDD